MHAGQAPNLSLVSDRLSGSCNAIVIWRCFLADHPQVAQVLDSRPWVEGQAFLAEVADKTTALDCAGVLDRSGDMIVSALGQTGRKVPAGGSGLCRSAHCVAR